MLSNYRVLDLTDERGHLAGLILCQLGAEVLAVEPPSGSSARRVGPFAGDVDDSERSFQHWCYNRGKKSVLIDLETTAGRSQLRDLVTSADILIENCSPGQRTAWGLEPEELRTLHPALVHASITPFGVDGPKAGWVATDLTLQASSGNMVLTGDTDRPPLRVGTLPQAFHHAASEAAVAVQIALFERQQRSGLGQHIDVSTQQSMNQASQSMMLAVPNNSEAATRIAGGANLQGIDIQLLWPCLDGYASVTFLFGQMVAPFTQNLMDWVHEEGLCDAATRDKDWVEYAMMLLDGREPISEYERVKQCLTDLLATKTRAELLDAALTRRLLVAPVWTARDVAESRQLLDRGYWEAVDHGDLGRIQYPGPFARFSDMPLPALPAAPTLGQHTEEVLADTVRTLDLPAANQQPSTIPPLDDLKVLDLTWVMAGPAASRVLADYGASVIRIESIRRPDGARTVKPFRDGVTDPDYSALWNNMNAGKRALSLDLSKSEAAGIVWDLIDWADVVMEAFSPGTLDRMGLGIDAIRARKPDIVVASTCLMGQTGPLAGLAGFGTMASAMSGFFHPVGWPDRAPCGPFSAYTDYTSPRWFAAAILAAVAHQRAGGTGQHIDLSQVEASLHLLGPALLEQTVNGRTWERCGNRDPYHAPHGVYPSIGDENWIAIACISDATWRTLAQLMGQPALIELTRDQRHRRADEIDRALAAWTANLDGRILMEDLQERGIPCHIVQNSAECIADPQLRHRGHFVKVSHSTQPDGWTVVEGTRFIMSRTPAMIRNGGPTFGEHTFEVLTEVLGYDSDQIADLAAAEALE